MTWASAPWADLPWADAPAAAGAPGAVGRADETDTALALSGVLIRGTGLASETDTALALAAVQLQAVGRADETDTALQLAGGTGTPVGVATETDTALALAGLQLRLVGLASETDTALALSAGGITVDRSGRIVITAAAAERLLQAIAAAERRLAAQPPVERRATDMGTATTVQELDVAEDGQLLKFDFVDELPVGVTISSAVVTVDTRTGSDTQPASTLVGSPSLQNGNTMVVQTVRGRVAPVSYSFRCVVTCSDSIVRVGAILMDAVRY